LLCSSWALISQPNSVLSFRSGTFKGTGAVTTALTIGEDAAANTYSTWAQLGVD
jgi:hypothetical protein